VNQPQPNPFVAIPLPWRVALITFVLVYYILVPGLRAVVAPDNTPLATERVLVGLLYQLVLFSPLFFYRAHFGWLHPLLFVPLFTVARRLAENPGQLMAPLTIFAPAGEGHLAHRALAGWSQEAVAEAMLRAQLISLLALLAYFFGFFLGPRFRAPRLTFPPAEKLGRLSVKVLMVVAFSTVLFVYFMHTQGGISAHLSSFGGGRFRALAGTGHIRVMIGAGTLAVVAWYALSRTATRNPLFWVVASMSVLSAFFVSGSRSGVIEVLVLFIVIWMCRHQKVPSVRIVLVGLVALVLLGSLGALRRSAMQGGQVDWSVLTTMRTTESIGAAREEVAERGSNSGFVAIVAKVPNEVGFLHGRSYVGTVLFFVPRAIWHDKPRGPGAMVAAHIFGGQPLGADAGRWEGGGVPPSSAGEAYWNFALPGVVLVFLLFGIFHRWLATTFVQYSAAPAMALLYVLTINNLSPTSTSMVPYLQQITLALAILWWLGGIRIARTMRPSRLVIAPSFTRVAR
jgi:hypothetical protein